MPWLLLYPWPVSPPCFWLLRLDNNQGKRPTKNKNKQCLHFQYLATNPSVEIHKISSDIANITAKFNNWHVACPKVKQVSQTSKLANTRILQAKTNSSRRVKILEIVHKPCKSRNCNTAETIRICQVKKWMSDFSARARTSQSRNCREVRPKDVRSFRPQISGWMVH